MKTYIQYIVIYNLCKIILTKTHFCKIRIKKNQSPYKGMS
jgi:hypothetical protein